MGAFPWSQSTDVLNQALRVGVGYCSVYIYTDLIDPIDEFTVKSVKQILLHHMFLKKNKDF